MDTSKIVFPRPESFISFASYTFPLALFILMPIAFMRMNQTGDIWNIYTIAILVLFPMAAVAAVLYNNQTFIPAFSNFAIFISGILFATVFSLIIFNIVLSYASKIKSAAYFALAIIAIIIGFMLLFAILTYFFTSETIQAFLRVFFSIPAIIVDFIEEFIKQFPSAPPTFVVLFIIEIILIILVILIPLIISQNPPLYSSIRFNGVHLLQSSPINLTQKREYVLANSHTLSIVDDPNTEKNPYQKRYTISMWIYMNPSEAAQNNKEVTIFYYGHKDLVGTDTTKNQSTWQITNPKPKVTYKYDSDLKRDVYQIYLQETDPTKPTYKFHIPNQKWNHFVFVFESDHIDLYLNGHLEKSFPQSIGTTKTYTSNDQIAVGDQENASYGAIANVIYYDYPMTQNQVVDAWNKQQQWVSGSLYVPFSRENSGPST